MNIHSRLKIRIAAASMTMMAATAAQAMPNAELPHPEAVAVSGWADKSDPYKDYGLQTFDTAQYRPNVDKLLSPAAQQEFELRMQEFDIKDFDTNSALAQSTILARTVIDLLNETRTDETAGRRTMINQVVSSFAANPGDFTAQEIQANVSSVKQGPSAQTGMNYDETGDMAYLQTVGNATHVIKGRKAEIERNLDKVSRLAEALDAFRTADKSMDAKGMESLRYNLALLLEHCPSMKDAVEMAKESNPAQTNPTEKAASYQIGR